ncbi:MAG: 50S ribosomal protein L16 [Candidatus Pacebacteria bacterium]|nr:50S ribosomal protein L16 [Candidatus Paceibacterota bacterium]
MLQPRRRKYRKEFKGNLKGAASRGTEVAFGDFGLKALETGRLSARELEAARKKITYVTKRTGKYWVRVFPHQPVTSKPAGVKMGSGKGAVDYYEARVRAGTVLFELGGIEEEVAREAFRKAAHKLSVKTKFVTK